MLTLKMKKTLATLVASLASACAAFAAERTLPTPPASSFPDTESSANVAVTNGPALGRRVKLTLSANFTPSNCVQVALGKDTDSDGDLAPEETHLVLGVDCGEPFIRKERGSGILSASEVDLNIHSTTTTTNYNYLTFTFSFKQPSAVSSRFTHARVTTRGRGNSAAQIVAEITRPGVALILR